MMKKIRVAAVQIESKDCFIDYNLKRAAIFAELAAKETIGKIWYTFNPERKRKALMISSGEISGGETR